MTHLQYELLKWEIKKWCSVCRITRKAHKRTKFQSEFQSRLNQAKYEARHHLLALCFFRGIPYRKVEPTCRVSPNFQRVRQIIFQYGQHKLMYKGQLPLEIEEQFDKWLLSRE